MLIPAASSRLVLRYTREKGAEGSSVDEAMCRVIASFSNKRGRATCLCVSPITFLPNLSSRDV